MAALRHHLVDDMLWLLPLGFGLVLLRQFGRLLPDAAVLLVWLTATGLIAGGGFLRARIRRRAWLAAYVTRHSPLQRWLRGGVVLLLVQVAVAGFLGAVLIVGILRIAGRGELFVLLASLPLMVVLHRGWRRLLAPHITARFLPEASWRATLISTATLLWCSLLALAFWRAGPDFTDAGFRESVLYMAAREQAASALLEPPLAMMAGLDGAAWWLAQHGLPRIDAPMLELLGWALVLVKSALLVWAWMGCCAGALLIRHAWRRDHVP